MASKNISLREPVYEALKAQKRPDESFSDTVARLLDEGEPNWRASAGVLSEEQAEELRESIRRSRERAGRDHRDRMDELFGQ